MNKLITPTYEYQCNGCRHRFEVVMVFREHESPLSPDAERSGGYPEQQPECPTCHSHDTLRVTVHSID